MSKPEIICDLRGDVESMFEAHVQCPVCGLVLGVGREQFRGHVSMDCPDCRYHERHDLRDEEDDPSNRFDEQLSF
jgi:phage FluMu protein Com